jgi:hypothetical protein
MDSYLDQIADLESQLKNISTLSRMVEQYKDKAVEFEREKFEAISGQTVSPVHHSFSSNCRILSTSNVNG